MKLLGPIQSRALPSHWPHAEDFVGVEVWVVGLTLPLLGHVSAKPPALPDLRPSVMVRG